MVLLWDREKESMTIKTTLVDEKVIMQLKVTNKVRNELNGLRMLHKKAEVVNAIVNGKYGDAYMPRQFPKGQWKITGIEASKDVDFYPLKIKTDAIQMVETWSLDKDGGYDKPTGQKVKDGGYHLHWSEKSSTTLGCGRLDSFEDAIKLAGLLMTDKGEHILIVQ